MVMGEKVISVFMLSSAGAESVDLKSGYCVQKKSKIHTKRLMNKKIMHHKYLS